MALPAVVLFQCAGILGDRLDDLSIVDEWALTADLAHEPIDVLELRERRPPLILTPPFRLRLHPHGERFREILCRMALGIPMPEMQHIVTACRAHAIDIRVRKRSLAERLPPVLTPTQSVRIVERMPDFVAQDTRHPVRVAAFDLAHHAPLQPHQARMSEIERNGDARYAVGREPLDRQPHVRPQNEAAALQTSQHVVPCALQSRIAQRQLEIAEAHFEQRFVRQSHPCGLALVLVGRGAATPRSCHDISTPAYAQAHAMRSLRPISRATRSGSHRCRNKPLQALQPASRRSVSRACAQDTLERPARTCPLRAWPPSPAVLRRARLSHTPYT